MREWATSPIFNVAIRARLKFVAEFASVDRSLWRSLPGADQVICERGPVSFVPYLDPSFLHFSSLFPSLLLRRRPLKQARGSGGAL